MEGSIKWKDPNFTVFIETVNALNALDAAKMNTDTEGFEMLSLCSPYTRHIANAFESIIELASVSLGFTRRNNPDGVKYVKGCPLNNDYCEMSKTDFIDMIYRSRYDTVMLHAIYNAFVNRMSNDIALIARHFKFSL